MRKARFTWCIPLLASLLLLVAAAAAAEETDSRSYPLSDCGVLKLSVPSSWNETMSPRYGAAGATIEFWPKSGPPFVVLVTPSCPSGGGGRPLPDKAALERRVQKRIDAIRARAVEKNIAVRDIKGPSAYGSCFSATDRDPEPGGYRHMTQGDVRVGKILLFFTILTGDGQESVVTSGLAMLAGASGGNAKAGDKAASPQAVSVTEKDGSYELTAPWSRVILKFPQGGLLPDRSGRGPAHPGYFYLDGGSPLVIVSGWFEPVLAYEGKKQYFAEIRRKLTGLGPVSVEGMAERKVGSWDVMTYSLRSKDRPDWVHPNLRASCVQAGTWIDVHLSSSAGHDALIALLKGMEIRTKP